MKNDRIQGILFSANHDISYREVRSIPIGVMGGGLRATAGKLLRISDVIRRKK